MLSYDSNIATFNSSKFLHGLVSSFFFITSQRYSMGFRSGVCDGRGQTDILFLSSQDLVLFALWHRTPFCWKIKSLPQFFPVFLKSGTDQPNVCCCVQSTVDYLEASNPTGRHAYLDFPSSVLSCGYITVWVVPLSSSSSNKCPPPWNQLKNRLVGKHLRPLFRYPILPLPTPLQSLLFVGLCAQRLPCCNTTFQTNSCSRLLIVLEDTWVPVASFNFSFSNFKFNKWIVSMRYTCAMSIWRTLSICDFLWK